MTRARNPEIPMARNNRYADPSAADALHAAMRSLHRELRAAPPEKAGDLARKLAMLAKDLAALEKPSEEEKDAGWTSEGQRRYDDEVERLITLRVHERVNFILESRGLAPDDPLPPEAYISLYDIDGNRG
jgi:hypothetical protein